MIQINSASVKRKGGWESPNRPSLLSP